MYYATKRHRLISVDVQSFYPSLISTKGIGPAAYSDTGRETYRVIVGRRLAVKKAAKEVQEPADRERLTVQADGLKLVLNSFFGKLGDPHSTLYDPGAFLAVTLSGQLMLIDLIERLADAKIDVISANTDGLFLGVPRGDEAWREVLQQWQTDTGMSLEVEPLKRLAILASNQFATRGAEDKVKRKGGELRGALDWTHSPSFLVINDAVANALLFDVPPERTIFECREPVRYCSVTKRSSKASSMVLVEGDTTTELPRVTRWYRAKDSSRRIEIRFDDGRHTTPSGAVSRSRSARTSRRTACQPTSIGLGIWDKPGARSRPCQVIGTDHNSDCLAMRQPSKSFEPACSLSPKEPRSSPRGATSGIPHCSGTGPAIPLSGATQDRP